MAAKRTATSDINRDNWDDKMEKEEPGEFKRGTPEELKTRVIKTVKRRLPAPTIAEGGDPSVKSAFSSFTGFGKSSIASASTVGSSTSPFSFLSKISSTTSVPAEKAKEDVNVVTGKEDFKFEKSTNYYERLEELNVAVTKWIKQHVDQNPVCILTPIFKDYEKYLKEIGGNTPNSEINTIIAAPQVQSTQFKSFSGFTFDANINKRSAADSSGTNADSESDLKHKISGSIFGQLKKPDVSSTPLTFNVKQSVADTTKPGSTTTGLFSITKPSFTFGSNVTTNPESTTTTGDNKNEDEEDDEPPKVEFQAVVEEDSVYSKKCKVFFKSGKDYVDRGIGTLHLKPVKDKDKTQLLVRADTNLGKIILNVFLVEGIVVSRVGKNNVMMVGIPTPDEKQKSATVLVRVKNAEEADDLLKVIKEHMK